ncbi:MAG: PEP/pyruvate-binding domain-containing protein [Candidatus Electryonea clarkiae]|nr:PEP/pyruvate-binding domain-containing protein [Candidatus Electryonea clarkiae]MDP8289052.1 PEP/pyruvate-binding domain-containing protein [Candidatus Electryonea clarkiae]
MSKQPSELEKSALVDASPEASKPGVQTLRERFQEFLQLLELNNKVLKIISDMEEKSQGNYLFDNKYILNMLDELNDALGKIIEIMIYIGGDSYRELRERFNKINSSIDSLMPGNQKVEEEVFVLPLESIGREHAQTMGSKNANLGEMKSKLDIPVPGGFGISSWGYKRFIDSNDLQTKISELIKSTDYKKNEDLKESAEAIRAMILNSPVPSDLVDEINESYHKLIAPLEYKKISVRSSAIGEDTLHSFAGQYYTFINVSENEITNCYRMILASKFTPRAIYYFLSHLITESDLAMGVCCQVMVDAQASGVAYSHNPVDKSDDSINIYSIYGLGDYLNSGKLSPDYFRVSRKDGTVIDRNIADKPVRLVLGESDGAIEEPVPENMRNTPSITPEHIAQITGYLLKLEEYYGFQLDIEWAVDKSGELYLLQSRPLHILDIRDDLVEPDMSSAKMLSKRGVVVCPGAGIGPIYHVTARPNEVLEIPQGVVLATKNPAPWLILTMERISALVTEVGGVANHLATIAREYQVPTLASVKNVASIPEGTIVTVDATKAIIYEGEYQDLVKARETEDIFDDVEVFNLLERIMKKISPLNLINPGDPNFQIQNCRTLHDIMRFAHQKAIVELFRGERFEKRRKWSEMYLKTDLPVKINILLLEGELKKYKIKRGISNKEIQSVPFCAFWKGVNQQGWQNQKKIVERYSIISKIETWATGDRESEYSKKSFVILGSNYMLFSLHLGYHLMTIESMITPEPDKNFVKLQHKGGGASRERRIRRIKLISSVLSLMGFEHHSSGDVLDTTLACESDECMIEKLSIIGRLTMMTKQLDMALGNDRIAEWHTNDIIRQLGLGAKES